MFVRGDSDPASLALEACGAERVEPRDFRMPEGTGESEAPWTDLASEV